MGKELAGGEINRMTMELYPIDIATFRQLRPWLDEFPHDQGFLAYSMAMPAARVYVDDDHAPRTAILAGGWGGFVFVCGDPSFSDRAAAFLDGLRQRREGLIIVSVQSAAWIPRLLQELPAPVWKVPRIDYRFDGAAFDAVRSQLRSLPSDYEIVPMDRSLLKRVRDECDPEFDPALFCDFAGIGFVVIHANRILSSAWAPTIGGWAEIGVATVEAHREKGFAQLVGAAIIDEARRRGIRPHVATNQRNLSACRWAQRLGFVEDVLHEWVVIRS